MGQKKKNCKKIDVLGNPYLRENILRYLPKQDAFHFKLTQLDTCADKDVAPFFKMARRGHEDISRPAKYAWHYERDHSNDKSHVNVDEKTHVARAYRTLATFLETEPWHQHEHMVRLPPSLLKATSDDVWSQWLLVFKRSQMVAILPVLARHCMQFCIERRSHLPNQESMEMTLMTFLKCYENDHLEAFHVLISFVAMATVQSIFVDISTWIQPLRKICNFNPPKRLWEAYRLIAITCKLAGKSCTPTELGQWIGLEQVQTKFTYPAWLHCLYASPTSHLKPKLMRHPKNGFPAFQGDEPFFVMYDTFKSNPKVKIILMSPEKWARSHPWSVICGVSVSANKQKEALITLTGLARGDPKTEPAISVQDLLEPAMKKLEEMLLGMLHPGGLSSWKGLWAREKWMCKNAFLFPIFEKLKNTLKT